MTGGAGIIGSNFILELAPRAGGSYRHLITFAQDRPGMTPVPSPGYPGIAVRPKNPQRDTDKVARVFGLHLPQWDKALQQCLQDKLKQK